jgi:murein DD-endopeptidase MepM/ murein hydrolase activator NlpD
MSLPVNDQFWAEISKDICKNKGVSAQQCNVSAGDWRAYIQQKWARTQINLYYLRENVCTSLIRCIVSVGLENGFRANAYIEYLIKRLEKEERAYQEAFGAIPYGLPLSPPQVVTTQGYSGHGGLDLAPSEKDTERVLSTMYGRVLEVGFQKGGYGNYILVASPDNYFVTRYAHLKKVFVTEGQEVQRGSILGIMGSTGRSTGPHLHYEVILNGKPVDPQQYSPLEFIPPLWPPGDYYPPGGSPVPYG